MLNNTRFKLRRRGLVSFVIIVVLAIFTVNLSIRLGNRLKNHDNVDSKVNYNTETISVSGLERKYLIYLPKNLPEVSGLIFVLHGGQSNPEQMTKLSNFSTLATQKNYIVVYPEAIDKNWSDGRADLQSKASDVTFIDELAKSIQLKYVNGSKINLYIAGISNGGMMAMRLLCDLKEPIAGVAIVAASMPEDYAGKCSPQTQKTSIVFFHGTKDPLMPFNGGEIKSAIKGKVLSANETVKLWADANKCTFTAQPESLGDTDKNDDSSVTKFVYKDCNSTGDITWFKITGGGHTWPSGSQYLPKSAIGNVNRDIDADKEILSIFMPKSGE